MTRFFRSRRFGVDDAGAIAVLVAILAPALLAVAAFSVDVARWYVEGVRLQKAADAAALAGVVFMPQDLPTATSTALRVAAMNGFTSGVTVTQGSRPSQLQVTIASRVSNSFAVLMGIPYTTVARTGISDYTGPAPMGSPCNVYGNEPAGSPGAGPTSVLPGTPVNPFCTTSPLYWGNIEGPNTDKVQGDRYMNRTCSSNVDGCTGGVNDEFKPAGYFYIVRVLNPARTGPITLQLYDPAWDYTSVDCSSLPSSMPSNNMNQYATTDAQTRYRNSLNSFCSGDYAPGLGSADPNERVDTSFALRAPAISGNPLDGAPVGNCSAQFKGQTTAPTATQLQQYRTAGSPASGANPLYNQDLSATFHSWFALCTFTPTAAGDYYLQVRTNVALPSALTQTGATKLIACSDTTNALCTVPPNGAVTSQLGDDTSVHGHGANQWAVRAVSLDGTQVSVAGYERMAIDINASNPTTTFNLIRAIPAAAGKFIKFDFFDAADGSSGGTVQVLPPTDATGTLASGSITGCTGSGVVSGTLAGCSVTVSPSANNGKIQNVNVPIPSDYSCNYASPGGCWFRVVIRYSQATDVTTWTATIQGDPVRLVK